MAARKGRIIPPGEVGTRMLLTPSSLPVLSGAGAVTVECGRCSNVLVRGAEEGRVRGVVVRCPVCGAVNDVTV